ncbi:MAG: response regulator [Armatimonadetes bacterium]|nr:response regulator [Armatimonadota bacterium]
MTGLAPQADVAMLASGLAWLLFAASARYDRHPARLPLWWPGLALYAATHAGEEWTHLLSVGLGAPPWAEWAEGLWVATGIVALTEFGRESTWLLRGRTAGRWLLVAVGVGALLLFCLPVQGHAAALLCVSLPALVWAAAVVWAAAASLTAGRPWLRLAAVGFAAGAGLGLLLPLTVPHRGDPQPLAPALEALAVLAATFGLQHAGALELTDLDLVYRRTLRLRRGALLGALLGISAACWWATGRASQHAEAKLRENLRRRVTTAAAALDPRQVCRLRGLPADLGTASYTGVARRLEQVRQANPDCRSACLFGLRDGQVVSIAGSEPAASPDYAPPGRVHDDASPALIDLFYQPKPLEEGPFTDAWGVWSSGHAPVLDPATGRVLAVFGMAVDASHWAENVAARRVEPISVALLFAVLLISFAVAQQRADQARQAIAAAGLRLRRVFDHVDDAVIVADADGRILEVNGRMLELFRIAPDATDDLSLADLSGAGNEAEQLAPVWESVLAGGTCTFEWNARRPSDGSEFPVEVYLCPMARGDDAVVVATVRDLTERRRLAAQLEHAHRMNAIGQLAGGVAHDFNNLLTTITAAANFLAGAVPPDGPAAADVDAIRHAAERAAELTGQLLAFSRRQVIQPRPIQLNELLEGMRQIIRRLLKESVALRLDLDEHLGVVLADPGQLEQAVMNLVANSDDAMPRGGILALRTSEVTLTTAELAAQPDVTPGDFVLLSVTDTGGGMDESTAEHVFEPFFTTKDVGRGTGLGLASVYGIVKQNRGHITCESAPGRGTTFGIYLPRLAMPEAPAAGPPSPVADCRGDETILLVEDEPMVRELLQRVLEDYGYRVLAAPDGPTALGLAEQPDAAIDLLLSDVVMPGMSGRELAERLLTQLPGVAVLHMSGHPESVMAREGVLVSGAQFIAKPFGPAALGAKVRQVLDDRATRA